MEERLPGNIWRVMEHGMDVNMLFLIFSSSAEADNVNHILRSKCEYMFAKGKRADIYHFFKMDEGKRSKNEIAIDFKIKSWDMERAFKKYRIEAEKFKEAEKIDFDALIMG